MSIECENKNLRVISIIPGTTVDGPGLRTSIYFSGCKHKCPHCHNPETWDFNAGKDWKINDIMEVVKKNDFDVTFSGGDPLYQDLTALSTLAKKIHSLGKTIWLYTGFVIEDLSENIKYKDILSNVDVVVDGPFIIAKKNIDILFRGSTNQRILQKNISGKWEIWKKYNDVILS
jgi:anaerobic ribonucleoside-triphosphate reductase activating protein